MALSPDGRFAYLSNVAGTAYDGKKPGDVDVRWPQGRIYRKDLSKPDSDPEPFFDLELPDWEKIKTFQPRPLYPCPPSKHDMASNAALRLWPRLAAQRFSQQSRAF